MIENKQLPEKTILVILVILSCITFSGCAFKPTKDGYTENSENHIVRLSRHGYMIKSDFPTRNFGYRLWNHMKPLTFKEADRKTDRMIFNAIKLACIRKNTTNQDLALCENKEQSQLLQELGSSPIKILMYVHGGLNTYRNTDQRMEKQLSSITADHQDWHYPIYLSWPTNPSGSYWEHLTSLRSGRTVGSMKGYVSSPFVLFEDIVESVAEFPSNVYFQLETDLDYVASGLGWLGNSNIWNEASMTFSEYFDPTNQVTSFEANKYYRSPEVNNLSFNRSIFCSNSATKWKTTQKTIVTPLRYSIGTLWNGVIASNSWRVMKRRAQNIVNPTGNFNPVVRGDGHTGEDISLLLNKLFDLKESQESPNLNLTIVGHSMGAIVLNNILTKYKDQFIQTDLLNAIVYMGAASSINDTLTIVPDILKNSPRNIRYDGINNLERLGFYNLTLNRVAEVGETDKTTIMPSGSLLVSIDKYHDNPEHHLQLTMGSELNVHSALTEIMGAFEGTKGPVVLKSFNKIGQVLPYKHTHFGSLEFWKKKTWKIPDNPGTNCEDFDSNSD